MKYRILITNLEKIKSENIRDLIQSKYPSVSLYLYDEE